MAKTIFDPLKDLQGGQQRATTWYRNAVSLIADRTSQTRLMREGRINGQPSAGRMNFFVYDPKYKKTLPFYDTFPLVLPLEPIKGGFMGLNFHYLPIPLRIKLLDKLKSISEENQSGLVKYSQYSETDRLKVSYARANGIPMARAVIKRYLYSHMKSQVRIVTPDEWVIAVLLPVQRFKKASTSRVYNQTKKLF